MGRLKIQVGVTFSELLSFKQQKNQHHPDDSPQRDQHVELDMLGFMPERVMAEQLEVEVPPTPLEILAEIVFSSMRYTSSQVYAALSGGYCGTQRAARPAFPLFWHAKRHRFYLEHVAGEAA